MSADYYETHGSHREYDLHDDDADAISRAMDEREAEAQSEVDEAARAAAIDAGELCPDCGSIDVKPSTTGPRYAIPLFECRECSTLWFDCVTRPTQGAPLSWHDFHARNRAAGVTAFQTPEALAAIAAAEGK